MWPFTRTSVPAPVERKEPAFRNASLENPETSLSNPAPWLLEALGGAPTIAGPSVSETSAMRQSAVFRSVGLKAGVIAALPLQVFERTEKGRKLATDHRLYRLLHAAPNELMSAFIWKELIVANLMLSGNHYSIIEYDNAARAVGLSPVLPQQTTVSRVNGRNRYTFQFNDGREVLDQEDVIHVPGLGFDGMKGLSPIAWAGKQPISISLAMEEAVARLHANAMRPGGWMALPKGIRADGIKRLRAELDAIAAGISNTGRTLLVDNGVEWHSMQMSMEDAQTLESRKFQVEDIARLFGVPPVMLGMTGAVSNWGTGVEQQTTGFKLFNLESELSRIEGELNRKLFTAPYYCEFNREALSAMDSKAQSELFAKSIQYAGMTPNEIRRKRNLPDVPGGDELYIASNVVPLRMAGKVTPAPAGNEPDPQDDPEPEPEPPAKA